MFNNVQAALRSPQIAVADLPGLPMSYPVPAVIADNKHRVFVDHGLAMRGEFSGCDHLAIAGHVESDLALRFLDVLEPGSFKGSASVGEARIAGRYEGALIVAETLVVGPAAHISGSVQCGKLQLEDGGMIDGDLRILSEEAKGPEKPADGAGLEAMFLEARSDTEADAHDDAKASGPRIPGPVDAMLVSAASVADETIFANAETAFRAALNANLGDVAALSGLGHLARQRGDLTGALRYFELIMAADSENLPVRRVSVEILHALSRHDEAAAVAKEVQALQSRQSSVSDDHAAETRTVSPAFDEAEAMFKSVLNRHPKNIGALAGLGHLARRRGDHVTMHKYYTAALALEPMNITLRIEVARAFKEQGEVALARQILETVLTEHWGARADGAAAN
ncbi:MAG TPA: polymer-forming cytoskeletal protein [Stellaceae bacterium]|jgi:cytoskeletal protein CcmA (bactofilin family)/thioredoxin-like negative regulator of GroEL